MLHKMLMVSVAVSLASMATAADPVSPTPAEIEAAQTRIGEYLKGFKGANAARVTALTSDGIGASFPDHVLFAVNFPLFPVARVPPEPLQSANVVAIPKKKDAKPILVTNLKALEEFFQGHLSAVSTTTTAKEAVSAWLRTSAELHQDGFYKFLVTPGVAKATDETITISGSAPVAPQNGDKGEIGATLTFKDGKLTATETKVNLIPGTRPRCQATKLLDPDPIIRGMAEDAIRMMGTAAKPYLDEQRAKANQQLRMAIDRIWARVLAEQR